MKHCKSTPYLISCLFSLEKQRKNSETEFRFSQKVGKHAVRKKEEQERWMKKCLKKSGVVGEMWCRPNTLSVLSRHILVCQSASLFYQLVDRVGQKCTVLVSKRTRKMTSKKNVYIQSITHKIIKKKKRRRRKFDPSGPYKIHFPLSVLLY